MARELPGQSNFDLVVLDMMMPDGSGEDLLPVIGAQQDPVPVIVFSGHEVSKDIVQRVNHVLTRGHASGERLVVRYGRSHAAGDWSGVLSASMITAQLRYSPEIPD
ncbi:MAG: PAS/PAC sensor hybrid histidine kinase [Gammaproteobacteria bacterium]|nr:MAG: PAS/PAC sensor hybrid histidine kinase [Gammaproteobacteria bacterium]TND02714.1 MAG: PAS/PAC sensor hybrid histidine kinase [Gammaproteobacteria bacterium]